MLANAQTSKFEAFGGYSYVHADFHDIPNLYDGRSRNWNGWEGSFATNFNKFVGVTFDVSGAYGPEFRAVSADFGFRNSGFHEHFQKQYLYAYLAGPQFLWPLGRVRLFAHGLAGATQMRRGFIDAAFPVARTDYAFGAAVGGGMDFRVTDNIALRVAQADYLMSKNFGGSENNLRISGGIVFHFGGSK
jgi:opacity protein-like surface antigen